MRIGTRQGITPIYYPPNIDCRSLLGESIGRASSRRKGALCLHSHDPTNSSGHDSVAHRGKPRLHDHMVPGSNPPGAHPSGRVRTAVSRLRGKANPCAWFQVQAPSDARLDLAFHLWVSNIPCVPYCAGLYLGINMTKIGVKHPLLRYPQIRLMRL